MLVLTRSFGETIHIGDDVVITVIGIRRDPATLLDQVRIGIAAPKAVPVWRGEIARRDGPLPSHCRPKSDCPCRCHSNSSESNSLEEAPRP